MNHECHVGWNISSLMLHHRMVIYPDPELGLRALTVRQPFASMIARKEKGLEYRSWSTRYRGDLLVCSSSRADEPCSDPDGVAVCIVKLADIARPSELGLDPRKLGLERGEDPFCWLFQRPRAVPHLAVRGRLKLWEPDSSLIRALGLRIGKARRA
jgi:hypothetical protein